MTPATATATAAPSPAPSTGTASLAPVLGGFTLLLRVLDGRHDVYVTTTDSAYVPPLLFAAAPVLRAHLVYSTHISVFVSFGLKLP